MQCSFWSGTEGVRLSFIRSGKPKPSAFVVSLNGTFRNECLNQHRFRTLNEARYGIECNHSVIAARNDRKFRSITYQQLNM
ncbi:integrase core domain-containing protein [Pseudidiomarina gelatinasegens]|uniref:integrase core domain-containing protein n=1 Tax=Pseudidiomarina gelatinasegens TaxID=2487740 RepID=UPI003C6E9DC6